MPERRPLRWLIASLALALPLVAVTLPASAEDDHPAPAAAAPGAPGAAHPGFPGAAHLADAGTDGGDGGLDAGDAAVATPPPPEPKAEKPAEKPAPQGDDDEDTEIAPDKDRKGEIVDVGFQLTGISKIDPVKETFELEGIVTFHSKKSVPKCDKGKMGKLFDGEAKRADLIEENKGEGGLTRTCKVGIERVGAIDVRRYPFDSQVLEIEIYDHAEAMDGVEFRANKEESGVMDNVRLPGWEVASFLAETKKEKEEGTKTDVTKAQFTVEVERPFFASFVKGLLAVIFQLVVTLIAVLLRAKAVTNRITMVTGALLAIAATHNTVSSQLGVSYLTTADKFFLSCYFSLLVNVLFSVLMLRADDAKNEARVDKLYKVALVLVPIITLIGMGVALAPIG